MLKKVPGIFIRMTACLMVPMMLLEIPAYALGTPDISSSIIQSIVNETTTTLASGVTEKNVLYTDSDGHSQSCFVADLDLSNSNVALDVGMPDDGTSWGFQTVRDQANAAIKDSKNVVAAVNGNYYNMSTGQPEAVLIKNGEKLQGFEDGSGCNTYFGITKENEAVIGTSDTFDAQAGDLEEAMGGNDYLVKDGAIYDTTPNGTYEPRTAVGIREDGSVFFVVNDGRQDIYSSGLPMPDLAQLMLDMGADQAINLDGGGSSTYVSRTPGDDTLTVKNKPSDGSERAVANSWLIVSKQTADHTFASAHITPNDKTYTPNSTVDFVAHGVDSSGASAALPTSGLAWSLADPSFGTIDPDTGVFTSNGKTGQMKVQISYNGSVVGTTWVEIEEPDDIHFINSEMSLDLGAVESLGFVARYQGRDVILKSGDITWNIPESLGTIDDQNVFHAAPQMASGTVTASVAGTSLSASIKLNVGQLPSILYSFEDGISDWSCSTAGRGETGSLTVASYPEEPVRFGNNSLKMNFDYTTGTTGSTLGVYAGPSVSADIAGSPTAVGMWVYATKEAQGYWLRMYLYDASGASKVLDLTSSSPGISWIGWKYVEAVIPSTYVGPFKTFPKQMIRIMTTKAGQAGGGPKTKGYIYVDNVRAVYGANIDDLYPPIIDSVNVSGQTYTQGDVGITAKIHDDATDKYMSGINWDKVRILVDGKDYTGDAGHFSYDKDGSVSLNGITWSDGMHKATIDIQDNFGNETTKDVYFTVDTGTGTSVAVTPETTTAPLGGALKLNVTTNNSSDIKALTSALHIGTDYPVTNVEFGSDEAGSSYAYDPSTGDLSLSVINSSTQKSTTLATIDISVPSTVKEGSTVDYSMSGSSITFQDDSTGSFCSQPGSVTITSGLALTMKSDIVGADGVVLVNNNDGNPVSGADVTMTDSSGSTTNLGTADSDGLLASAALTASVQKFTLTAHKDSLYSFPSSAQSYAALKDKIPSNILAGTTSDPKTEKSFSWMSNPLTSEDVAVMQIATDADYAKDGEDAFTDITGSYQNLKYTSNGDLASCGEVRESNVTATGLTPDTAYYYRVGDGANWSDIRQFTTAQADTDTFTFHVFGDTQVSSQSDLSSLESMITSIENSTTKPVFGIHVGDFTDDAEVFSQIDWTSAMFSSHPVFDSIDMIHVLGNHEYMGDDGVKGNALFSIPDDGQSNNSCYSVDYGNMHIAVISWIDNVTTMQKEMEWLKADMKASDRTWKVVATHQPSYNTNPEDSSTLFNTYLVPVCDEAGIDLVFNGHDHAYGRTYSLKGGEKSDNGTVYISAGTTSSKHYAVTPGGDYWASLDTTQHDISYVTCEVNGSEIHLVSKTVDGTVLDDAVLTKNTAPTSLPAPTGLFWDDTTAEWGEVTGASGYTVTLYKDGSVFDTESTAAGETSYNFKDKIKEGGDGDYVFTVIAKGSDSVADSGASPASAKYGDTSGGGTVTSFDPLSPSVKKQTVSYGTALSSLNLPQKLKAVVDGVSGIFVKVAQWVSDITYNPYAAGTYHFTPVLDSGYEIKDSGINLPEITVTVKGKNNNHSSGSKTNHTAPAAPATTVSVDSSANTATVKTRADNVTVNGNTAEITAIVSTVTADTTGTNAALDTGKQAKVEIDLPKDTVIQQLTAKKNVDLTITVPSNVAKDAIANMATNIRVDTDILAAAKTNQADLTIRIKDADTQQIAYTWTFKGEDLAKSTIPVTDVNISMAVRLTTEVPQVNKVTPDNKGLVLIFDHSGVLPSTANVTFSAKEKGFQPGQNLYFYYYNSTTGQIESQGQQRTVDTDGNVTVQITHCSNYVLLQNPVRTITLDTRTYTLSPKQSYITGVNLTGISGAKVKAYSSTKDVASVTVQSNGNVKATGLKQGLTYIMIDVYDSKNKFLTHASVRLTVKNGEKPNGNSARQYGIF